MLPLCFFDYRNSYGTRSKCTLIFIPLFSFDHACQPASSSADLLSFEFIPILQIQCLSFRYMPWGLSIIVNDLVYLTIQCRNVHFTGLIKHPDSSLRARRGYSTYEALWMLTLRPLGSDAHPQSPRGIHRTAVPATASDGKRLSKIWRI